MKKMGLLFLATFMILGFILTGCGTSNVSKGSSQSKTNQGKSSQTSIGKQVDWTITGIDPGAGEMKLAKKSMEKYGLKKWTLQASSGVTMTTVLAKAIKEKKPVIVTGWSPHWMFAKYDLKYLKDPKGVFGKSEGIDTVVTKGFQEKHPNAAKILKQFKWTPKQMGVVMLEINNGMKPTTAAKKWIKANPDVVSKWTEGTKKGNGMIKIAYVAWSSAIASNNVIKQVLVQQGYNVKLVQLEDAVMWASVAKGSADATVCAWLPSTDASYWKKFKGQVTDLSTNLQGTRLGLVVPKYVKINSIEDLKSK